MDQRGKNTPLIIIIILVCLVGLGVLNYVQTKANPTEDEKQQQQQEQQQAAQAKADAAKKSDAAKSDAASHASDELPAFMRPPKGQGKNLPIPSELTIGNPSKALIKVTIGYTYDEATAHNSDDVLAEIQLAEAWAKKHPVKGSLQVVCIDLPPDQLTNSQDASIPLGVSVNGNPAFGTVNPGEGDATLGHAQNLFGGLIQEMPN